ncbi:MAG: hypothetical protein JNM22_02325 [Saprospiraceae bacterium]|nr:hypothetical protein [Saprospiraceae bacterium]
MKYAAAIIGMLMACWPLSLAAQAPTDSVHLLFTLPARATFASTDHLSNIYLIGENNAFEKYDSTGKKVARYTNNRLGALAAADVSNPLKILLWYADFQTIVTLDRTLNEIGQIPLIEANYLSVRAVAMAQDGNIWLYDDTRFRLLKISPEGAVLQESQPMNLIFPRPFSAACIHDNGNMVFVSDPQQGIATFDQYGVFLRAYQHLKTEQFEVLGDWLIFIENNVLRFENPERLQSEHLPLPSRTQGMKIWTAHARVMMQTPGGVEVYAILH